MTLTLTAAECLQAASACADAAMRSPEHRDALAGAALDAWDAAALLLNLGAPAAATACELRDDLALARSEKRSVTVLDLARLLAALSTVLAALGIADATDAPAPGSITQQPGTMHPVALPVLTRAHIPRAVQRVSVPAQFRA